MSYTELEHGYQDLRSTSRPIFYVGDINTVQPSLGDPAASSLYRSSKRGELSDGCDNDDGCMGGSDLEGEGKQVLVGVCAMAKKSQSKPMKEILTRLEEFEYIKILVFPEEVILKEPVEDWPIVDCLISFHSKGFPLDKAIHYANLRNPFIINNLPMQYDIQDRRRVYAILDSEGIEIPRYAVLDRDSADPKHHELVESEDHVEVNGVTFNKPFVEKPVSAEDHNIYIYYPTSAGGGSQRLFRKIGSRSSVYSPESRVRKTGSYIYEDFMPTDGTDVKVYTVGPDYAHAEARKSPALDGKVERDSEGKEIRYPVILSNAEKLISRKVCLAFKQTVCGFDLLRANGKSFVCDVNGFSFVKNSNKYYDDCAKILGNMILRELAPTLHIPWSVPFQLDDPPIVPTTFGKMMELRCVVAVIRHGDRTPKQKMKVEVRHPKFFEIFAKYDGYKHGHVKLKRPKQLQEILDTARSLLTEIQHRAAGPELEEKQGKLEQLKSVLEMYGHFSGINRKVQMKYQPRGRPRGSSSDDGNTHNRLGEPSLVLILKWGGELTPAGRIQAEELGRIFRCMYPGGQGRHLSEDDSEMLPSHGEYAGAQGLGLLRLHSTFRHDLKIYASDEGRVQMTAAAFAKGLLALEGELTPILVQMVKSANTNGLLDNDCDSSKYQNMVKTRLHELLQQDREFTREDREQINPGNALSINDALDFVKNPVKCCQHVQALIQKLMDIVRIKKDDLKTKDAILYHGETWELMGRRWGKIEKDFCTKNKRFDISKIPDIYDCIKYDLQHNNHTLQFDHAEELYIYAKYLADIVIPQEYGLTVQEKLTIGQGICTPLLKKIRADLQRNIEESGEETVNRLNPRYSHGVSSPGRHVRTRLYFTSESHVHSLLTVLRYGGLLDVVKDEQWRRAMEYVSMVSELNYMSQIVVMLYEDPTKDPSSEERFHVELHFSPGVNCCVQKNLPPGPGFRPHSRNESSHNLETTSQCSTRIEEEDTEIGVLDDEAISPQQQSDSSPPLIETEEAADSTLDSPTTSRAIDMMDLDPNMMDEPYDSGFLQGSAPIPISARTVAGHEAARLGSQLAASQRQRREREASSICEPRARSYDHQRQDKPEKTCTEIEPQNLDSNADSSVYLTATKLFMLQTISDEDAADKLQYQSLDAVNKEDDQSLRRFELDNLFYERVDNLVGSQSSRTIAHKYSPSCLGTSAGLSGSSSSPDLSGSLVETTQLNVGHSIAPKRNEDDTSEKYSLSQNSPISRERKIRIKEDVSSTELSLNLDKEFWDFGETQLLEKSSVDDENETLHKNKKFQSDEKVISTKEDAQTLDRTVSARQNPVKSKMESHRGDEFFSENDRIGLLKNVALNPRINDQSLREIVPSRKLSEDLKIKFQGDHEIASSRDVLSGAGSEVPSETSSSQIVPSIERSDPRETPNARMSSYEKNSVMTRSPSCLGIPVSLPHSVSSPELPAPVIETILESSGPLVTLHNTSLASPTVKSPSLTGSIDRFNRNDKILLPSCCTPIRQSCNLMPLALQTSETKRYGRSKSALTLPTVNDARGEFACRVREIIESTFKPTIDRSPLDMSSNQQSLCHHCKVSKLTSHNCYYLKTQRSVSLKFEATKSTLSSSSRSNSRRASLTLPGNWDEVPNRPVIEGGPERSAFLLTHPNKIGRSVSQNCRIISSHPNSRRTSLTVPGSKDHEFAFNRSRSMSPYPDNESKSQSSKYSTSLPTRPHLYYRENFLFPANKSSEIGLQRNQFVEYSRPHSLPRRNSLTVPTNQDCEMLCGKEDFVQRQDRSFAERSRSLSPCPQRCLCYNCNVSTLIQQSVNLSPAERSNFQVYFARSLSHKFINCSCYKMSMENAEASRRVSRSASPNSTSSREFVAGNASRLSFGRSLPCLDAWHCPNSRNNRNLSREICIQRINDENSSIGPAFHQRAMGTVRVLERRQSTPQNLGSSSKNSCKHCRDVDSGARLNLVARKEEVDQESRHSLIKEMGTGVKSSNVLSVDDAGPVEDATKSNCFISEKLDSSDIVLGSSSIGAVDYPVDHSNPVDGHESSGYKQSGDSIAKTVPSDCIGRSSIVGPTDGKVPGDSSDFSINLSLANPVVFPLSIDCNCCKCSSIPGDDVSSSMNYGSQIQKRDHGLIMVRKDNKKAHFLPKQFSCPEIIAESSNRLMPPQQKDLRTSQRLLSRQLSFEMDEDALTGDKRKITKPTCCLPRQSTRLETTNDCLGDKKLGPARKRKSGLPLPRQFSCPEISTDSADLASHSLAIRLNDKGSKTSNCDECVKYRLESLTSLHSECCRNCQSTANNSKNTLTTTCKNPIPCYSCTCLHYDRSDDNDGSNTTMTNLTQRTLKPDTKPVISFETINTNCKDPRYKSSAISSSSSSSHPRLQTQRSFSSPDTRPSIIQQPDPTCTARRHRHSISGQMSYFKLLGYNVSKKLTGSANSLFSTAVISGSSSAPNLKDMVPPHASAVAAIEGFGGVPPIRPLETLHNALSLRQLDSFLDMMTSAPLFRTPASSPPKFPSPGGSIHGGSVVPNLSIGGINREYHSSDLEAVRYRKKLTKIPIYIAPAPIHYKPGQETEGNDLRNQLSPISPNSTGWSSEPQSFLSSDPSSPAPTSAGECSMSMSLVSNDGTQPFTGGPKFSTNPCLDLDFNDFCMSIDQEARGESRGSISYTDYYSNEDGLIRKSGGDFANLRERAAHDEASQDSIVDEDEEHTLTLRQTEEEQKRDIKFIFEQNKEISTSLVKPGSSYKKIGRFRVESMEITDEDVRIKEAAAAAGVVSLSNSNLSLDRVKGSSPSIQGKSRSTASIAGENVAQDSKKLKGGFSSFQSRTGHRGKTIARSQSVSTPQNVSHKADVDYSCQASGKNMGSFSTMSCEDLENWKLTAVSPTASSATAPIEIPQDEPILTLASSLKGSSNITVGFNVQDNKKD